MQGIGCSINIRSQFVANTTSLTVCVWYFVETILFTHRLLCTVCCTLLVIFCVCVVRIIILLKVGLNLREAALL